MDYEKLGYLLQKAREESNIKQKEIALILDVTTSNISSWERGKSKIDISSFIKVCDVYQVKVLDILSKASNSTLMQVAEPGTVISSTTEPTEKESQLLSKYRILDDIDQVKIDERMDMILEHEKYTVKKELLNA